MLSDVDQNHIRQTLRKINAEDVKASLEKAKEEYTRARLSDVILSITILAPASIVLIFMPLFLLVQPLARALEDLFNNARRQTKYYNRMLNVEGVINHNDKTILMTGIEKFLSGEGNSNILSLKSAFCSHLTNIKPKTNKEAATLVSSVLESVRLWLKIKPFAPEVSIATKLIKQGIRNPGNPFHNLPLEIAQKIASHVAQNPQTKLVQETIDEIFNRPKL